jgi:GntR family transcriptional regulator
MKAQLPKYLLIRSILADRLEREYAPGTRIPSEAALCADFGVSRITIQQALNQLEKDGLIRREQGRGTFYLGPSVPRTETKPSELLEKVMKYREGAFTRVLRHGVERASPRIAARLSLAPGAFVVAIDRLSFVDDEPIAFTEAYLPEAIGTKIIPDLELLRQHTLASLLKDRHGIQIDSVVQTIGAALADPKHAPHLGIELGAPVIAGERTYFDAAGRPVFVSQTFYRADRHRFVVTLKEWR